MSAATRLAGFGLALTAVLGAAYGVGAAVGPLRSATTEETSPAGPAGHGMSADPQRGPAPEAQAGQDEVKREKELHLIAFVPAGGRVLQRLALGADAQVAGPYTPAPAARAVPTATVAGYAVTPQLYLGARGHLVALREGDLAYLHVHPHDGSLAFPVTFPAQGRYRLFLHFQVDGRVRTASFTAEVTS
jgi:hypothetical protein